VEEGTDPATGLFVSEYDLLSGSAVCIPVDSEDPHIARPDVPDHDEDFDLVISGIFGHPPEDIAHVRRVEQVPLVQRA